MNVKCGALGAPEAAAIVDRVAEEIGKYPAEDIIATRDTHPENCLKTQEGYKLTRPRLCCPHKLGRVT